MRRNTHSFFVISRIYKNRDLKMISTLFLLSLTLLFLIGLHYRLVTYALPGRSAFVGPNPNQLNIHSNGLNHQLNAQENIPARANVIRPTQNTEQTNVIRPTNNCPIGRTTVVRPTNNCNSINGPVMINSDSSSSSLTFNNRGSNNFGTPVQEPAQYTVPILVSYLPIANAGYNQIVHSNDYVILDGRGSYDPYGSPLYFAWTQLSSQGSIVPLSNYNQPLSAFVAPQVTDITTLTFELRVNNGNANSNPSYTSVTIYPLL